jgi:hypothetical protein
MDNGWRRDRLGAEPGQTNLPDFTATADYVRSRGHPSFYVAKPSNILTVLASMKTSGQYHDANERDKTPAGP